MRVASGNTSLVDIGALGAQKMAALAVEEDVLVLSIIFHLDLVFLYF